MASLNQIQLIGNVGRDPEVRILPSGDKVAVFSVATTEKWKSKNKGDQEKTEWHKVEAFGKVAEIIEEYVHKGDKLFVQGQMVYDEWNDKDGNKRTMAKVKIGFNGKLVILSSKYNSSSKPESSDEASDDDIF